MREFKFRAWDKVEQKMYPCFGFMNGQVLIIKDGKYIGVKDDDFDLMQFTGRLDKQGQEIYEYDFIQRPDIGIPMLVRWNEKNAGFDLTMRDPQDFDAVTIWYTHLSQTDYEIIGNFYEHPELLAKQK